MANTIKIRRGLSTARTGVTPAAGELLYTTDTRQLFVGDGTTPGGNPILGPWAYLATQWSTAPSKVGTTASGAVFAYTLGGATVYRLVPTTYTPAQDAFYSTFSGGVLSGLIATRG